MKPMLLVDVDGVLNHFGYSTSEQVFVADGYTIQVPSGTALRMQRLLESFEPVWCTAWQDRARDDLAPFLGYGADWPFIRFSGRWSGTNITWKLLDVKSFVGEKRAVAWIDDDLQADAIRWAEQREGPTRLARCDPTRGLQDAQTDGLIEWARTL